MNLHKARDAGVVTACICGGKAQAPAHVPRLTPRLWLERRWQQQHEASRRSAAPSAAASSTLDVPADQDAASGHETLVQPWSEVVVLDHEQVLQQRRASRQPVPAEFSRPAWPQHQQQLQPHLEQPEEQLVEQAGLRLLRHQLSMNNPVHTAKADSCRRQISAKAGSSSQQLMQAIKAAHKVHQLEQIYRQSRQDMDMLHCSSMLNRLAHLYQRQSASRQQQQLQEQAPVNRPIDIAAETAQALAHTLQAAHRPQSTASNHMDTQYHTDKQAQQHYSLLEQQQQQHAQVPAAEADPKQHSMRSRSPRAVKQQCKSKAGRLLSCLLHEFVNSHITAAGTRQLSSTLWVMAKCSRLLPDKLMLQQTAAALLSQLLSPVPVAAPAANTAALSALPSAASEYFTSSVLSSPQSAGGVDQPGRQQQLRRSMRHRLQASGPLHHHQQQQQCTLLHTGSSIDIANTVWAVGRLSQVVGLDKLFPRDDSVSTILRTLEQLCCYHLLTQRPDAVFISSCMCGFALMNHQVHHLFAAVVHRAGDRYVKTFQSQQLLTVCWSLAKLGHYDQQLFTKLMWRAVVVRKALLPQHVSLLLWAAGRVGHKGIDPRAVAQLLQVWKQPDSSSSSSSTVFAAVRGQHVANLLYGLMQLGQLQQQRGWVLTWLLQVVMQKLDDLQPAGIAVVLTALLQLTQGTAEHAAALTAAAVAVDAKNPVPAGAAQLKTGDHQQQLDSTAAVAPQASQPKHQGISSSLGSQQQVLSSVSQYPSRQLGVWSSSSAAHSHQLVPLYRELSRRITAQISNTRPHTLYQTTVALARAGYYDARLYTKLAAAAAVNARPADVLSADGVPPQPTYSMHQQIQLVCVFAHYQHPVPALWSAVLPSLTTAAVSELSPQHLVMLVSASRFSGCEQQQTDVVEGLLHLTSEALQQQSDLSVTQLVQLAATGSWWLQTAAQHLCYDEDQEQASSSSNMKKRRLSDLISDIERHLHRLVPRLVSVVLSQPHVAAMQHVPLLLEAAVTLQGSKDGSSGIIAAASTVGDGDDSASVCSSRVRSPSQHVVGLGQLQRLANTAVEHLCHWRPSALVMLLSCHTQAVLFDPLLADAYAEELLARIEQCSVQSLVQLLSVLAASSKGQQSYCHSQLTATAARQLHGKLLLACDVQLQAAVTALRQLGQEDSPACRAAARLLMHGSNSS